MFRRTPPAPDKNGHKSKIGNGNGNSHGNGRQSHEAPSSAPPAVLRPQGGIETVLGANCAFNGVLTATAGVRIDGCFDGSIEVNGPLVIGEGARVVAETVRATTAIVAGSVRGNIIADKVEIQRSGRIYGDIHVISFVTEEGAVLRGSVTMRDEGVAEDDTRPVMTRAASQPA